ncbi:Zinc-regulated transporter 3 [Colletotrichum orbiculare MAFF 240422]|uniref:Zinc-regulated transporter 3 n=1 Tax=Colletotrichum orbiculare (strain 104-T / ATCC 96160 / CBS 514.97 / LARS 414 / MAFF 240422) TaxID=1213857 RepID=N4URH1_COLOR|nr:Zinc-regulated transporter 3 [Colletotrichum orbiculare MAFF 240422]
MEVTDVDNDTRGWIMCIVSGIACVFGSTFICVDVIVRLFPGKRNFKLQESNVFLASSLSLSFGIMMYTALNGMLPSAKQYLKQDKYQDHQVGLIMMGCFVGGFLAIQVFSRFLHQHASSEVVECDHSHDEPEIRSRTSRSLSRRTSLYTSSRRSSRRPMDESLVKNGHATEHTPLLGGDANGTPLLPKRHASSRGNLSLGTTQSTPARASRSRVKTVERRPSMAQMQERVMSFVKDTKADCDEEGPCHGYTDPCGQECFKHLDLEDLEEADSANHSPRSGQVRTSRAASREPLPSLNPAEHGNHHEHGRSHHHSQGHGYDYGAHDEHHDEHDDDLEAQHHHHVPTNAFLALGLQTAIAISLHKFPEGFITYATNHANPALGLNVFMGLFVHNITEGFTMALPLYMAYNSRIWALVVTAFFGGLSQPLGAGIAVLLLKHVGFTPNPLAYGCMFAITAGTMVSVGLQLFVEALSMNHNRNLCMLFGFTGMALVGVTNAIASTH